ncbi:MAG: twin-arginine translocase TatA/TatE family subunit [Ignavibacteria bacterium CG_4_8_14_3_um_filter_37_9]|nr:twin-arginine translocase TatA/TatE family subunit [Ignavibacteria bacterium]OIO13897.1 MAG: Sec-independent protein translocase TatA [Ignavibacteria bacterium CG1_02_37_35]PIP79751.1 MAG: twin-arginine translocase TatA/TatE family subunit [Ignavibacteria bacterium CG22_combo_CG10-13_8_21_14_all_37_15]PIS45247.1 MAG: twin-arginine translocase TatA/TatE family subunit [Ignavibacteria bacterium CG08_land_8_20_14_0_20_37_9]PIX00135.1 MAG: twin-arginine translocase TatA/TatE family subunit [Igna
MFSNIGLPEILIIMFVLVLLFGAKKIPELAQGIGKGMKEFKKAVKDDPGENKITDKNQPPEKKD